jgi:sulfatase modifying factor 1
VAPEPECEKGETRCSGNLLQTCGADRHFGVAEPCPAVAPVCHQDACIEPSSVTWPVAYAFCIWDGGFLPSTTELNYAATGGSDQRAYPWGPTVPSNNTSLAVYGCFFGGGAGSCSGLANIAPTGSVLAGAGKWGQLDLSGGMFERAADWTGTSPLDCVDCAVLTPSADHVKVGGSFAADAYWLATSGASGYIQLPKKYEYGLRCARTP